MSATIALSHSSISCFDTCPRQYEGKYVTKEAPFVQTPEAKWGDDVHNALEAYGKAKASNPMPSNMAQYQPYVDAVLARPGDKVFEGQYALDIDAKPCSYWAKTADKQNLVWIRAKIDVINLRRDIKRAEVFDWKTGKVKNDPAQLVMYAMFVFLFYPEIDEVRAGYCWLGEPLAKSFTTPTSFYRHQLPQLIKMYRDKYDTIEHATETGKFPPRPSGLCAGWCPIERCEHWKPKRK